METAANLRAKFVLSGSKHMVMQIVNMQKIKVDCLYDLFAQDDNNKNDEIVLFVWKNPKPVYKCYNLKALQAFFNHDATNNYLPDTRVQLSAPDLARIRNNHLVTPPIDDNPQMNAALINASAMNDVLKVDQLLKKGADVRADDNAALRLASKHGQVAVVDRLLEVPGINADDVRALNNAALTWASAKGHLAVVDRLLRVPGINAADVRADDNYALRGASQEGYVWVVDRLLQVPGINANDVRADDNYALKHASANGHHLVVDRLLQMPDMGVTDVHAGGYVALKMASKNGHLLVVERLLRVPGIGPASVEASEALGSGPAEVEELLQRAMK